MAFDEYAGVDVAEDRRGTARNARGRPPTPQRTSSSQGRHRAGKGAVASPNAIPAPWGRYWGIKSGTDWIVPPRGGQYELAIRRDGDFGDTRGNC